MDTFQEIPGSVVITRTKGVYRQTSLFRRGSLVYAKHGSGFIRLFPHGGTSEPSTSWKDVDPGQSVLGSTPLALTYVSASNDTLQKPPSAILTA